MDEKKIITTIDAVFSETIFPFKIKTASDLIASQMIPGGLSEIKQEKEKSDDHMSFAVKPTLVQYSTVVSKNLTPSTPSHSPSLSSPLPSESSHSISSPSNSSTMLNGNSQIMCTPIRAHSNTSPAPTPPILLPSDSEIIATPQTPTFIPATASQATVWQDSMIRKEMDGFDRNQRRRAATNVNYYGILQDVSPDDESNCNIKYLMLLCQGPFTYKEALETPDAEKFKQATVKEHDSFIANEVYDLVPPDLAIGHKPLNPKWVLTQKWDGTYKARLTVNGSRQRQGVDYFQSRADTLSIPLLRLFLCISLLFGMIPFQYDVPNAFLQSPMDTPVFLRQPAGFIVQGHEDWLWKLKKCVYGLKQASLQWKNIFEDFLIHQLGFVEVGYATCIYILKDSDQINAMVAIYVDDFILST